MKPITFWGVAKKDGTVTPGRAWPSRTPGLAVARYFEPDGPWTVVHLSSGTSLGWTYPSPEAALALTVALAPFADWTLPGTVLTGTPGLDQMVALFAGITGGELQAADPHPEWFLDNRKAS